MQITPAENMVILGIHLKFHGCTSLCLHGNAISGCLENKNALKVSKYEISCGFALFVWNKKTSKQYSPNGNLVEKSSW